jgi:hypothetical protein
VSDECATPGWEEIARVGVDFGLGRPETTGTVPGDPDKPIRIVVESISSRRREQLADVEAEDGEVLDVTDEA